MLRLKYFQSLEQTILELTKKKVAGLVAILSQPPVLQELTTFEAVFEKLVLISNPIEFEGEARNQALKRL